jgi:hypothetical protein
MRTAHRSALLLLSAVLLLGGCAKRAAQPGAADEATERSESAVSRAAAPPTPVAQAAGTAGAGTAAQPRPRGPRKLVRTVDLELRVADTEKAAARLQALTAAAGGYVAAADAFREEGRLHYRLTLKVPVERLDAVLGEIRKLAKEVEREQLRTEDVTAQYVDVEARLRTLRATETELRALLAESRSRGHKAEDIMAIYRELLEIRTSIEQTQGQLDALSESTTYSTINVALRPTEAATPLAGTEWSPSDTVRRSARALVRALQVLVDLAIFLLLVALPVVLLVALPLWALARLLRRLRRKRQAAPGGAKA